MKVKVVTRILEANERLAEENRKRFKEAGVFVVNLMGAPGAGKTSLLEKTILELKKRVRIGVIEGDIAEPMMPNGFMLQGFRWYRSIRVVHATWTQT